MKKPELLMPAGSLDKLKIAFMYGADAVYAGVPFFSLRARENEFDLEKLRVGVQHAHALNKKIYLTVNVFARNLKINSFHENLEELVSCNADALIMSDPGLISIVRERFPQQEIHLSVQANCMNWESVKFWQRNGISRIILSRELRLAEIREIHERVPEVELEAFVHGSMCIAYSGRCLMSHYMSYRDANQGVCDNSCRYPFRVYEKRIQDRDFLLQDLRDPGQLYPIEEDEHGSYIMNAKDLCLIDSLRDLYEVGVCSFKVEGRTKSDFFAAVVAQEYRRAIDNFCAEKPFDPASLEVLQKVSNRGYHRGFLSGELGHEAQSYKVKERYEANPYVGRVLDLQEEKTFFEVKGKIKQGDIVEVISPQGRKSLMVLQLFNGKQNEVQVLNPGMGRCGIRFAEVVPKDSFLMRADAFQ